MRSSTRSIAAVASLAALGPPLAFAGGGSPPPRYRAAPLQAFEGGITRAYSLNDDGLSTGESGSGSVLPGTHAFVAQPDGTLANIETLVGYHISSGEVVNSSGQVAGTLTVFAGQVGLSTVFRYTPGVGMVNLGTLGGTSGWITDMNDRGDIIGVWTDAGGTWRGFLYTDKGGMQSLDALVGATSRPMDINNAGQVVGYYYQASQARAFLWDGALHDLGTLGGGRSQAYYVNDNGVVVGGAELPDGTSRAFRFTFEAGMQPLPLPLPGSTECVAQVITSSGIIAGWHQHGPQRRGFIFGPTDGMNDIGVGIGNTTWTGAVGANDDGVALFVQVDEQTYEVRALVCSTAFGTHDLNDLVVGQPLPWSIVTAAGINSRGQVLVGWWSSAALLTPVTPGDLNGDGHVDQADLGALLAHYGVENGATYEQGDIDGDGAVSQADLGILLAVFGV